VLAVLVPDKLGRVELTHAPWRQVGHLGQISAVVIAGSAPPEPEPDR
jgi:hypothetical protein